MHLNHRTHLHLSYQLNKFKKGIYTLYLAHSIKGFVSSLIGFFIPVYLLTIGFNLIDILLFFGIRSFFMILFSILAGGIGNKLGLKHTMAISLPLFLLYLIGTMLLKNNVSILYLYALAIISAFASSLYWVPMHSLFARFSSKKDGNSKIGALMSFRSMATMFAPLLGGIITLKFGFEALFVISILILLIPTIILLYSKDIHPHINFSIIDLSVFFKKHRNHFTAIMLDSFGTFTEEILWPLFVFMVLFNTMSVGIVGSLIGVGTIIFTIVISKIIAKYNSTLTLRISSFMLAIIWTVKFFIDKQLPIYLISLLAGLFLIMFSIPLASRTYHFARKSKNLDEFIIFKEIVLHIGRILAVALTVLFISKINISFLVAGLSYFLVIFL